MHGAESSVRNLPCPQKSQTAPQRIDHFSYPDAFSLVRQVDRFLCDLTTLLKHVEQRRGCDGKLGALCAVRDQDHFVVPGP